MTFRPFDHIVIATHDLAALRDFYAKIGFQVGHRNIHPWGTENHIVQFDGTFLELIALPGAGKALADPAPYFAAFVRDYLAEREGLAMLVLASTDAQADFDDFARHSISAGPIFDFARTARRPDGQEIRVAFSLAFAMPPVPVRSGFFTCQQHYPENFWNKSFQIHENGTVRLKEVIFFSSKPDEDAAFFAAFSGVSPVGPQADCYVFGAAGQHILLCSARGLAEEIGIEWQPDITQMAALHFSVRDLSAFALHLERMSVRFASHQNRIVIAATEAFGACLLFSQD